MYNLIPSNPPTFPRFMSAKREWCLVSKLAPLFQVAERNDTRFQQALLEVRYFHYERSFFEVSNTSQIAFFPPEVFCTNP